MKQSLRCTIKKIKKANSIGLFCHSKPDFDCLCSMNALDSALLSLGKKVDMYNHREFDYKEAQLLDNRMKIGGFQASDYDLLIAVDCNKASRIGEYGAAFAKHGNTIFLDHHEINEKDKREQDFIDSSRSACCEIIFELLKAMKIKVTPHIATLLYTGLFTDCGNFTNLNVTRGAFICAGELMGLGADIHKVSDVILRQVRPAEIEIKKIFYNKIENYGQFALVCITNEELNEVNATKDDCGTFSFKLNCIDGVKIGCSIVEGQKGEFYCSIRSKKGYAANKIAMAFDGGGHKLAAGCEIKTKTMASAKKKIIDAIKTYLKERENA